MSQAEQVLGALETLLEGISTLTVSVDRNAEQPEKITKQAHYILRDGDPGEPDAPLGNQGPWIYEHEIPIEVFVEEPNEATRHSRFDQALAAIETALEGDPTLGGLIHGFDFSRPEADEEASEGSKTIKAATLALVVVYQSNTRL